MNAFVHQFRLHRVLFVATVLVASGVMGAAARYVQHVPQERILRIAPFVVNATDSAVALTVYGQGLSDATQITIGGIRPDKRITLSADVLSLVLSSARLAPGWYDVRVRTAAGGTATLRNAFAVRDERGSIPPIFHPAQFFGAAVAAASTGIGGQSVRSLSASYDNTPHINVGTYTQGAIGGGDIQFIVDNIDVFMGGDLRSGDVRAKNAHVQFFPYIDLTYFNNGNQVTGRDGHTDAKIASFVTAYNETHDPDLLAEDLYLHAKCDCDLLYGTTGHCKTYSASDPQCTKTAGCPYSFQTGTKTPYYGWNPSSPGTPNDGCLASTASSRAASRMPSQFLPQWDVPNYKHLQLDDYFVDIAKKENIAWSSPGSINGLMFDTVVKDNGYALADGLQMSWEYWGADVRSTTTPTQAFDDYYALQSSVQSQLNAVQGQSAFRWPGNVITIPDEYTTGTPSIYAADTIASVPEFFVETFFDGVKNGALTYQPSCTQWKSVLDETINKGKTFSFNSYERSGTTSCSSGSSDCRTDRGKIESLAMYYLLARPVSASSGVTHYLYSATVTNGSYEQRSWNGAVSVDIGQPAAAPAGAKDIFGNTGTTNFYNDDDIAGGFACPIASTAPSSLTYARNFTNGLVLVQHRHDYADTVYGDGSSSDTTKKTYSLDAYYHPVQADGTLGGAVNSVTLSNSQGAILLKNRAPVLSGLSDQSTPETGTLIFTVTVSDPDGDSVALGATGLPNGATYIAGGPNEATFAWTPDQDQSGTYIVTFTASDPSLTASRSVVMTVTDRNRAPVFEPLTGQTVDEGVLLAFSIVATDADGDPVTITAKNLPAGATLTDHGDSTATFRWLPSYEQAGEYGSVQFSASDGKTTAQLQVLITVTNATPPPAVVNRTDDPPAFSPLQDKTGDAGALLVFTVAAVDPEGASVRLSAENLPAGATFTDAGDGTGSFRWIPKLNQAATYNNVRFTATDGTLTATSSITITIHPVSSSIGGGTFSNAQNFYAFSKNVRVGSYLAVGNVRGDLRAEIVVGTGAGVPPEVRVFGNDGGQLGSFLPYGQQQKKGVRVATCDLTGDGIAEIVTAPGPTLLPRIRTFNGSGKPRGAGFVAFYGKFRGGANIACGNVTGDARAEIVLTQSVGGDTFVYLYNQSGRLLRKFSVYSSAFHEGLVSALIDMDGDGRREIAVAPEYGKPQVQVLNAAGKRITRGFFVSNRISRGGLSIAAGDVDGNHTQELLTVTNAELHGPVSVYRARDNTVLTQFLAYAETKLKGVRIAVGDVDADGTDDIITVPAGIAPSLVKLLDAEGKPL